MKDTNLALKVMPFKNLLIFFISNWAHSLIYLCETSILLLSTPVYSYVMVSITVAISFTYNFTQKDKLSLAIIKFVMYDLKYNLYTF